MLDIMQRIGRFESKWRFWTLKTVKANQLHQLKRPVPLATSAENQFQAARAQKTRTVRGIYWSSIWNLFLVAKCFVLPLYCSAHLSWSALLVCRKFTDVQFSSELTYG